MIMTFHSCFFDLARSKARWFAFQNTIHGQGVWSLLDCLHQVMNVFIIYNVVNTLVQLSLETGG